jgi:sugar lactone lactonase YvrE
MKQLLFAGLMLVMYITSFAQHSLEKIWESDSVTVRNPESVLYDSKSNSLYVSSMGSGSVVRMDLDGKIIQKDWTTGLHSNKGSALYNDFFYTAETSAIAVVDVKNGSIVKRIPVEGAQMLNDVAIDSKGIIYVIDTRAAKVYRIEGDKPAVYLENMPGANGLLTVNTDLYVLTSTACQISNYQGILYYVHANGTKQLLLDTRPNRIMSNDIGYNSKTKTLYVPSFGTNRIIAYKVK